MDKKGILADEELDDCEGEEESSDEHDSNENEADESNPSDVYADEEESQEEIEVGEITDAKKRLAENLSNEVQLDAASLDDEEEYDNEKDS